jgi:hypothetical protein
MKAAQHVMICTAALCCLVAACFSSALALRPQKVQYYSLFCSIRCTPKYSYTSESAPVSLLGCTLAQETARHSTAVYNITLQHQQENGTVSLPFSFTYPLRPPASKRPLILFLNGASVESFWYRRVIGGLADKGYVIVSTDYYRQREDFPSSELCRCH